MHSDYKCSVLVTGFGPFNNHVVNASWEAVKELNKLFADSEELKNVKLITEEIPVSYDDVATYLPKLLEEYNPMVVLNVGVSSQADCLTIECCAHNNGYVKPDICEKCPDESTITPEVFKTAINVDEVCEAVNKNSKETECNACVSDNAGRYLCEYIFYKSLQMKPQRTLFVHVPDLNKYSSLQTAKGLYCILSYMINSLEDK
ncbi:pyroglutamyl-peptidase 1 [Nomia melanderi]|uniref:pyroglutamyl-peptidase 1 n=1 Tax=Nomia melanderi TaxID=2448451 RepID=UPI00130440BC|nr:pyroglutamyl-peptidase 1 [Nomia melanderi]